MEAYLSRQITFYCVRSTSWLMLHISVPSEDIRNLSSGVFGSVYDETTPLALRLFTKKYISVA